MMKPPLPKRDQFGYLPLNLNVNMHYVTGNPGHYAAMNTPNAVYTPSPYSFEQPKRVVKK